MMALIVPLLYVCVRKAGMTVTTLAVLAIIGVQYFLIQGASAIDNKIVRYVADETVLYAVGYSTVAVLGLKIREFTQCGLYVFIAVTAGCILLFMSQHGWSFDPQDYKYPPQSLYLLYGLFGSATLWSLRPVLGRYTGGQVFRYFSENSMWIYLWHIIPVYAIAPIAEMPDMWVGRYVIVMSGALMLNYAYQQTCRCFKRLIAR